MDNDNNGEHKVEGRSAKRLKRLQSSSQMARSQIGYVPEEIIFRVLLYLPADVIYNKLRYVCPEWYNIIRSPSFVSSHLERSTPGLLLQDICQRKSGYFVKAKRGGFEVKKLEFECPGIVESSCNGLVFLTDFKLHSSYIVNPITKQQLRLPWNQVPRPSLAYAGSCGLYKAVALRDSHLSASILTVGVDKEWRALDISHLSFDIPRCHWSRPLSIGRFVYWSGNYVPFILSFDVETETFQQIPPPHPHGSRIVCPWLMSMGKSLSILMLKEAAWWEVWILTDPPAQQWEKLSDIYLRDQRGKYGHPVNYLPKPIGWLQSRELMVFQVLVRQGGTVDWIVYNINTRAILAVDVLPFLSSFVFSCAHTNSFVPL